MIVTHMSTACGLGTNSACCHKSRAKGRLRPSGSRNLWACPVVSDSPHQPKGRYGHHCGTATFRADSAGHRYLWQKWVACEVTERSYLAQIHLFGVKFWSLKCTGWHSSVAGPRAALKEAIAVLNCSRDLSGETDELYQMLSILCRTLPLFSPSW